MGEPMTAPTWWPRFTAWLSTAGQSLLDGLSVAVWGPEDIEYVYRRRHAEALQLSTDRARKRVCEDPCQESTHPGSITRAHLEPESKALHDHLIRELVRSVAQATVEYVAERGKDHTRPLSTMWACRELIAEHMAMVTFACAEEDPESELSAVRRCMRP